MAKKRKKEEKKEVFKKPEFDEVEFMQKEIKNTKVAIITIIFAVIIAVVAGLVTLAGLGAFAFLIGVGAIFLLRYVYEFLNIDTSEFEKKDWLGNAAMFFFTFLAIWVLVLNVPFVDLTNPNVKDVLVEGCPGLSVLKKGQPNTCDVSGTTSINVIANVTDNSRLDSVILNSTSLGQFPLTKIPGKNQYAGLIPVTEGKSILFTIIATDANGHTTRSSQYTLTVE